MPSIGLAADKAAVSVPGEVTFTASVNGLCPHSAPGNRPLRRVVLSVDGNVLASHEPPQQARDVGYVFTYRWALGPEAYGPPTRPLTVTATAVAVLWNHTAEVSRPLTIQVTPP